MDKAFEMLPISSTPWLDLVARAKKTFYGCGLAYLEEIHNELKLLIDKKVPPWELYRIASAIVSEESDPNIRNLRELIGWIETLQDYRSWWEELLVTAKRHDPLGLKVVRKEIQDICKYITNHFREDLQLSVLADNAGLSVNYLGMLFRQETGQYFSDYLMRVRMIRAKELLERSTYMIYEVANEVGITDYRYFCKLFKKMYGITPTQYKSGDPGLKLNE
jgi:YesN/AraC family two-component response regulator